MTLTNAERETVLNLSAANRATWEIYSDDLVMIARLERIGATFVRSAHGGGKSYTLRSDQVLLRKGKREVSPERREAFRKARLAGFAQTGTGIPADD